MEGREGRYARQGGASLGLVRGERSLWSVMERIISSKSRGRTIVTRRHSEKVVVPLSLVPLRGRRERRERREGKEGREGMEGKGGGHVKDHERHLALL